jgi:hypothetical protein
LAVEESVLNRYLAEQAKEAARGKIKDPRRGR